MRLDLVDFSRINKTLWDTNAIRYQGNDPIGFRNCLRGKLGPTEICVVIGGLIASQGEPTCM